MPLLAKEKDHDLWARFLNGDEQVLSLIYLRHVNALFDYGCKISADQGLVKDCIQDIFCTIIRNRDSLSYTDNIRLYLFKALKRKVIRELQKKNNFQLTDDERQLNFEIAFMHGFDHVDTELSDKQKKELIDAIESLTSRQKEAIYLRFTRGMDYEEISMILNLNYQSARALIHRAISKLRIILKEKATHFNQILLHIFQNTPENVL